MNMSVDSAPLDPYARYAHMRATAPVHFNAQLGVWEIYGYHDIQAVLGDPATFSSDLSEKPMLVFMDPPRHTQLRRLVARAFTSKLVADMEPSIQAITDDLLDRVAAAGRMDVVSDLAHPLPVTVIAELLGMPAEDRERFRQWALPAIRVAEMELQGQTPPADLVAIVTELDDHLEGMARDRLTQPRNDLISGLAHAEVDGERLTMEEIRSTCRLLLIGGFETTRHLIGNTVHLLLAQPEALAAVHADESLLPTAIEESLRYQAPFQFFARKATRDVVLGGQQIKAGQQVMTFNASGNRDESAFENADRFDVTRTPNRHLSLGHGIHYCLGAGLGRLEARIAISTLLRRFPALRLDTAAAARPIASVVLYGLECLPVLL